MKLKDQKNYKFMNELDCVKLIKPFKDLKVGTKGGIVLKYTENDLKQSFSMKMMKQQMFIQFQENIQWFIGHQRMAIGIKIKIVLFVE